MNDGDKQNVEHIFQAEYDAMCREAADYADSAIDNHPNIKDVDVLVGIINGCLVAATERLHLRDYSTLTHRLEQFAEYMVEVSRDPNSKPQQKWQEELAEEDANKS